MCRTLVWFFISTRGEIQASGNPPILKKSCKSYIRKKIRLIRFGLRPSLSSGGHVLPASCRTWLGQWCPLRASSLHCRTWSGQWRPSPPPPLACVRPPAVVGGAWQDAFGHSRQAGHGGGAMAQYGGGVGGLQGTAGRGGEGWHGTAGRAMT